jgi:hypothetical protein
MYQNQTSLALVHMPDIEMWNEFDFGQGEAPVARVGINFGAPGDRLADSGTLWLDYPSVGGRSPDVPVRVEPEGIQYYRHHATALRGDGLRWVSASGCEGVTAITVRLGSKDETETERPYTVRLYFAETEGAKQGDRVFSVALQGKKVIKNLDITKSAGGSNRTLVREFKGIRVKNDLTIALRPAPTPANRKPIICGIEAVAETN